MILSETTTAVLWVTGVLLMSPCMVLFVECVAGAVRQGHDSERRRRRPRIAVIIPAHNEENVIAAAMDSVNPQLRADDRVLVVADNCSDRTAEVGRRLGAQVVQRFDAERQGKGYALAHAVDALRSDPPEIVVILDADMRLHEGSLDALAELAAATGRPTQGFDLLAPPPDPGLKDFISALSFIVRNQRARGLTRLGLPCQLMGTGMALPWPLISSAQLMTGNLVEDLQLGLDLAVQGHPALFCSTAKVTGCLPTQDTAALAQRTRWEHGHLQTMISQAPRLLGEALRQWRPDLLALAMDLLVPPLSLLVLLLLINGLLALVLFAITGAKGPVLVAASSLLLLTAAVLTGWWTMGRNTVPLRSLAAVPLYILWKLPLFVSFIVRRQRRWVRAARDQSG